MTIDSQVLNQDFLLQSIKSKNLINSFIYEGYELTNLLDVKILQLLEQTELNREQMVRLLDTPRTTLYNHLDSLVQKKLIEKFRRKDSVKCGGSIVYYRNLILTETKKNFLTYYKEKGWSPN